MNVMDGSRWILATLLALSGLACSKSNVSPAPWAEADAALDKVGVPVVLHFNVGPAAIKSGRRAMLAIVYPQSGDGKVEDCIRRTEPAFKVALVAIYQEVDKFAARYNDNKVSQAIPATMTFNEYFEVKHHLGDSSQSWDSSVVTEINDASFVMSFQTADE